MIWLRFWWPAIKEDVTDCVPEPLGELQLVSFNRYLCHISRGQISLTILSLDYVLQEGILLYSLCWSLTVTGPYSLWCSSGSRSCSLLMATETERLSQALEKESDLDWMCTQLFTLLLLRYVSLPVYSSVVSFHAEVPSALALVRWCQRTLTQSCQIPICSCETYKHTAGCRRTLALAYQSSQKV